MWLLLIFSDKSLKIRLMLPIVPQAKKKCFLKQIGNLKITVEIYMLLKIILQGLCPADPCLVQIFAEAA